MSDVTRPPTPPPGWYPDPTGALRWWDGTSWGPLAAAWGPQQSQEEAGKVLSVLSWLGFFVLSIILPLIVYVVERDKNRFTRWHASEALNFQLTFTILWVCSFVPMWLAMTGLILTSDDPSPWPLAFFLLMFVLWFAGMGVSIYGAVQAGRGAWWRCPVAIPFLREHRRELAAGTTGPTG